MTSPSSSHHELETVAATVAAEQLELDEIDEAAGDMPVAATVASGIDLLIAEIYAFLASVDAGDDRR